MPKIFQHVGLKNWEKPTVCNGLSCSDGPAEEHLGQHKVWWWCRMNGSKSSLKVNLTFRARRRRRCWLHAPPSPRPVTAPGRPCRKRAARRSTWVGFRSSLLFCRVPCYPRLIRQAGHPSQAGRGACRRCPPEKSMSEGSGQQYAPVWYR